MSPAAMGLMRASRTLLGSLALVTGLGSWDVSAASAKDPQGAMPAAIAEVPMNGETGFIEAQQTLAALKSGLRSVAAKARTALPAAKADDDVIWIEDATEAAKPASSRVVAQKPATLPRATGAERPMRTPLHERLAASASPRVVRISAESESTPSTEPKVTMISATAPTAKPAPEAPVAASAPSPAPAAFPVHAAESIKAATKPAPTPSEENPLRDASRNSFGSVNPLR